MVTLVTVSICGRTDTLVVVNMHLIQEDANRYMRFSTANTERMRIDASGNLLHGKNSISFNTDGFEARVGSHVTVTSSGGTPLLVNRKTSDGDIVKFYKDGTAVGSIGTTGGDTYVGTGDCAIRFSDGGDQIRVCTNTGSNRDGAIDLGYSDSRFKDLYLSGSIANPSGDLTLDVGGNIVLDADGGGVYFKDAGTNIGFLQNSGANDFRIVAGQQDKDIVFMGNDNGSTITALTLDMSDAGHAKFNSSVSLVDNAKLNIGTGSDLQIYHDGSNSIILDQGVGNLQIRATNFNLLNADGNENYMSADDDGAVTLYHDNTARIATSSSGVTVTGTINGGDLRGEVWLIGRDSNDHIGVNTNEINFVLDGNTDMRLENDGDLHVDGNVIAYSTTISDERLKKDIVKIDNALDKVSQLNGYTFEYLADGKKSAGVIAQEVEKVMPSAITESTLPLKMGEDDKTEYKTVQYDQLHGLMIEAIKELKAEIEELKAR